MGYDLLCTATLQGAAAHVGRFAKRVGHLSGVTGYRRLADVLLAGREEVGREQKGRRAHDHCNVQGP